MQVLDLVKELIKSNKKDADVRFDKIEKKLDELLSFKWKFAGAMGLVTFFTGIVVQIIIAKFGK